MTTKEKISNSSKMDKAANYIIENLKREDIKIMRYNSITTDSIYLKLDDGVIGSLRISDHPGKRHLKYKYNLILGGSYSKYVQGDITRYFFPFREIGTLVAKIMWDKSNILSKYGANTYKDFMYRNRERGNHQKGFWEKGQYV